MGANRCSTHTPPCCLAWGSSIIHFPPVAYADCHGPAMLYSQLPWKEAKELLREWNSTSAFSSLFSTFINYRLYINDTNVVKTQIPSSSFRNHSLFLYLPPFQIYPGALQPHPLWNSSKPTDASFVCLVCLAGHKKYILGISVICERIVNYVCVGLWTENLVGSRDPQNIERVLENAPGKI